MVANNLNEQISVVYLLNNVLFLLLQIPIGETSFLQSKVHSLFRQLQSEQESLDFPNRIPVANQNSVTTLLMVADLKTN